MKNEIKIFRWTISIFLSVVSIGLFMYICLLYQLDVWIIIVVIPTIVFIGLQYIAIITFKSNTIVVKYPFRIISSKKYLDLREVLSIKYIEIGGLWSDRIMFLYKQKGKDILHLELFYNYYELLKLLQSKGIVIEVEGTDNNTIEDLRH